MSDREEFEDWYSVMKNEAAKANQASVAQLEWIKGLLEATWNASRAALVVDLPVPTMSQYANRHSYNCAVESLGWAKDAIEAAGVQVKP